MSVVDFPITKDQSRRVCAFLSEVLGEERMQALVAAFGELTEGSPHKTTLVALAVEYAAFRDPVAVERHLPEWRPPGPLPGRPPRRPRRWTR
jgi:hypothetical protein